MKCRRKKEGGYDSEEINKIGDGDGEKDVEEKESDFKT